MTPLITILCGGNSAEREISLKSAENVARSLSKSVDIEVIDIVENKIPESVIEHKGVVFPVLHGGFGEDGRLQLLLENNNITYAGSDAPSSTLCIDKAKSKEVVYREGVPVLPHILWSENKSIRPETLHHLGEELVIKPNNEGSSVGFHVVDGYENAMNFLNEYKSQCWLVEKRVHHREFTVGILNGSSLGVGEIRPKQGGYYDFEHKYMAGVTDFLFPAPISDALNAEIKSLGELCYRSCQCRDFARVDLLMDEQDNLYFLEINTIPGLTENSLLPRSAQCEGYDFDQLCLELIQPAIRRYQLSSINNIVPK